MRIPMAPDWTVDVAVYGSLAVIFIAVLAGLPFWILLFALAVEAYNIFVNVVYYSYRKDKHGD